MEVAILIATSGLLCLYGVGKIVVTLCQIALWKEEDREIKRQLNESLLQKKPTEKRLLSLIKEGK